MEEIQLNKIPALETWKMLSNTIQVMHNMVASEKGFERLSNTVQKPELFDMLIFSMPNLSYEGHQLMTQKYKEFTIWVLGQFFYLSTLPHFNKVQKSFVSAQNQILHQIQITPQGYIYNDLILEYVKAFEQLNEYARNDYVGSITLNAFFDQVSDDLKTVLNLKPLNLQVSDKQTCSNMHIVILQMTDLVVVQMLDVYNVTVVTKRLMDCLLWLLECGNFKLKHSVLNIYVKCLKTKLTHPPHIENIKDGMFSIFERIFFTNCSNFDQIALDLFQIYKGNEKCQKLYEFVLSKERGSKELEKLAIKYVECIQFDLELNYLARFKHKVINEIKQNGTTNIYNQIYEQLCNKLTWKETRTADNCQLDTLLEKVEILIEIILCTQFETQYNLLDENHLVQLMVNYISLHLKHCNCDLNFAKFMNIMSLIVSMGNSHYAKKVFQWLVYLLNKKFPNVEEDDVGKDVQLILAHFKSRNFSKEIVFEAWCYFLVALSCNFDDNFVEFENYFLQVAVSLMEEPGLQCKANLIKYLVILMSKTQRVDEYYTSILAPAIITEYPEVQKEFAKSIPGLFTILCSDFVRVIHFNDHRLCVEVSDDLVVGNLANGKYSHEKRMRLIDDLHSTQIVNVVKGVLRLIKRNNNVADECRILAIKALPAVSKFVPMFSQILIAKWMEPVEMENETFRNAFVDVIYDVLSYPLNDSKLTEDEKQNFMDRYFELFMNYVDKSLRFKVHLYMQDALISILEKISYLTHKCIELNVIKHILYFIIMQTSTKRFKAITVLISFRKRIGTTMGRLFTKYRPELCKIIVLLCAVNHLVAGTKLSVSLETFAIELGYANVKHLFLEETRYLLPYFVSLYSKIDGVEVLIEKIASYNEVDVRELLAEKYGYIYVHLTLSESDKDCDACLRFVERTSGESGVTLRKNNFMIILNELLLNFYQKRDRVLARLTILASEDTSTEETAVPEYLWPRFLGVLQYFDLKLLSNYNKENKLLSLAALFKYMGARFITPVRFKIIAMLRTVLTQTDGKYPELTCTVWDAFIQSCDLEILGPQLATICVSMYPLMKDNEFKINEILKFLIVENENMFKDNIVDLFFLLEFDVDVNIQRVISKHLQDVKELPFKEHLKFFMRYLTYETFEVQIYALKYIKNLLQTNRSELEVMILGHNGIDPCIVELINYLLQGCREYDSKVRLACGDCIGELGAIEPSHLPPPRSIHEEEDFNFSITEPKFILSSLNEFARAMQAEANCQIMDCFAFAIQETLRTYRIGPDYVDNVGETQLWNSLSESQKDLMLPFLSSKYCNVSNNEVVCVGAIYGSNLGSNFKSWLYNWTTKLISSLISEKKQLLCAYIPSMKQDLRTLMYFLPHILLNSLIEGGIPKQREAYDEFMAVIESRNENMSNDNIQNNRPIRMEDFKFFDQSNNTKQKFKREDYLKVVFVLFDFLERWLREWIWENGYVGQENQDYQKIKEFTRKFSKYQLAKSNFEFGGYPRALMYLEDHIMANKDTQDEYLSLLSEIYYRLNEPDGVAGVAALRKSEASLEQRILDHKVSGQFSLAAACYERLPLNFPQLQGLVKSELDLDNAHTSLYIAKGVWDDQPIDCVSEWMLEAQAEPLWRLGRYDELDELVKQRELQDSTNWGVQTGLALLHFKNGDRNLFRKQLEALKMLQVEALGASSLEEGTYQHGYYYISRLHAINEMEQIENCVHELLLRPNDQNHSNLVINKMQGEWELRLKFVQQCVTVVEPILCLRRAALEIARERTNVKSNAAVPLLQSLLGDTWLKSAVVAMNSQFRKQAYSYILKAEEFAPPRLFLEKAKWFWLCNEHEKALTTLERHLRIILPTGKIPDDENYPLSQRKICAEAKLYIASYNDAISNVVVDVNIQHYKESVEMFRECEKSLVNLAEYYDRVFQNIPDADKDIRGSDMQIHMINYFGKSLQYGTEYIYQSMPRLLSIWFDYGTRLLAVQSATIREQRKQNLLKMTKLIDTFLERLPSFIFLSAFSQLISRICHSQKEVYKELNLIIAKLILKYPQQTLWMMISVIKSSYVLRSKRCSEILSDSRLKTPIMIKFLNDFIQLAEKLIDLTNKNIALNITTINVSSVLRALPRLLTQPDFSEIMIPTHKFRKLILPNQESLNKSYNPFPNHYVYIVGIEDSMTILPSLQRPRRITLRGSDGKGYIQMLKPKDDLRKDFRLMEFNDIVNQLLSKEAESRERRLNIRLYSVSPLNEECGMIEWVPNLVGLRPTLMTIYKQRGLSMKSRELKEKAAKQTDPMDRKRSIYNNILLPRHPPVLGDWFRRSFPDAHGWLTARTAYTRTTAVMSMVGHILGLGDRHGENILLDSTCGDAVHVDFNCLFNKGEQFDWPERVPFRLTPNMVAAMGPLGVEGMFRKSCACTLYVLRTHANTLMSIVTPFVYDPLVSWPKRATTATTTDAEMTNALALEHIKVIQRRLQGEVQGRSYSISLSVEGQTNKLITEAMSVDNLCQMYIGWGPYL